LQSSADLKPEHWARIKALTRRLGELGLDEYDTLRPVADFIAALQKHVRVFLERPEAWEPARGATEEMMTYAINKIVQLVSIQLHETAGVRLVHKRVVEWRAAYAHRGTGSTYDRKRDVEGIYGEAAPIPGEIADPTGNEFLREMRILLRDCIEKGAGRLQGLGSLPPLRATN
jgi:hypothetical protein